MASSSLAFLALAIATTLLSSNTLASPSHKPTSTSTSAAPSPTSTTYPQLPPDIAPLLPSSGGSAHSPSDSFMPIIPSSRSPPNPDITGSTGLGTAFGPMTDSSAQVSQAGAAFPWLLAFWLVMMLFMG